MNEHQKIIADWLRKAEYDWEIMNREILINSDSAYGAVCFHAQQCVEKLIKGLLTWCEIIPQKEHNLEKLKQMLPASLRDRVDFNDADLFFLTNAGIRSRYPDLDVLEDDAQRAFEIAGQLRSELLPLFKI